MPSPDGKTQESAIPLSTLLKLGKEKWESMTEAEREAMIAAQRISWSKQDMD